MEHLENIALEAKPVKDEKISKPYEGLALLDDKLYSGGTSIRYWM